MMLCAIRAVLHNSLDFGERINASNVVVFVRKARAFWEGNFDRRLCKDYNDFSEYAVS